jgi:hypothetical protein
MTRVALCLTLFAATAAAGALERIRKEPQPERRAQLAIDNAPVALEEARAALRAGSLSQIQAGIEETVASLEVALRSLRDTGKKPSKLSRFYKRGELHAREAERRLEDLIKSLNYDDRPPAEKALLRLQAVHEEFLLGVMSKN